MMVDPGPSDPGLAQPGRSPATDPPVPPSRGRKILRGLRISVLTLAGLTVLLEVGLRVSGDRMRALEAGVNRTNRRWVSLMQAGILEEISDPVRRYAMKPGASCEVDGWEFRVTSHRSRGADFPTEKPAGEKRLLCLGDSFCFGMWCDEEEALAGQLARLATQGERAQGADTTWRGVNLGVPGYTSEQQLRALEQDGLELDPDRVVLYFNTNDIDEQGFFFDEELGALRNDRLPLPTGLRRLLWHSHLYGLIARLHYQSLKKIPAAHLDPRVPWSHTREHNKRHTRAAIERIAELCRERDIPLFFVNQPLWTWSGDARNPEWRVIPLVRWAEELRRELGLPGIELLGFLRGYADGVDRFGTEQAAEGMFLVDLYVADEAVEDTLEAARQRAKEEGLSWEELALPERVRLLGGTGREAPREPDFHLTGEAYGHIARLCYPILQEAGYVP